MTAIVLRGDAAHLPLPDASVDLIVTSPPYFGLRSYTDGGEHYQGQIGSEATPAEFVAALVECTREWMRVLRPGGSMFINLGDKYSDRGHGPSRGNGTGRGPQAVHLPQTRGPREKSLLGLPWRYALACTDQLGLILRAEIVWAKPNGLPESVTDRVRRSHEQLFHFTVRPRYFAAVDEIREPQSTIGERHGGNTSGYARATADIARSFNGRTLNPLGKLPGSVWTIPSAPLKVPAHLGIDHFAAFPPALVRPIVLGWSPAGICTACGEGRRPVVAATALDLNRPQARRAQRLADDAGLTQDHLAALLAIGLGDTGRALVTQGTGQHPAQVTALADEARAVLGGYAREYLLRRPTRFSYTCACPTPDAPTRPATVLDPFGGTGTTALVAAVHGRTGITVDMSADYCRLAAWRTQDPAQRAKAAGKPPPKLRKPRPQVTGQGALFPP